MDRMDVTMDMSSSPFMFSSSDSISGEALEKLQLEKRFVRLLLDLNDMVSPFRLSTETVGCICFGSNSLIQIVSAAFVCSIRYRWVKLIFCV
jgi:hypothetical protein